MARRPKGSGSIYTLKDGTVVGQYEVDTPSGKKRKYIRGKNKKDVASKLAKAIADRDSGLVFDSQNLTLSEYLSRWLGAIEGTIREGSWKQYEMVVRVHIDPDLGQLKLEKLTALHVQNLYRQKLEDSVSQRRVLYIHATLHKALDQAVKWLLIPRNVTNAVERPKITAKEIEPLTAWQAKRLLDAARGDKLEALYVLAVSTGMRQGELLGLKWEDVDLQNGILRVNRTIFGGVVSPPKTSKGRRTIKLSRSLPSPNSLSTGNHRTSRSGSSPPGAANQLIVRISPSNPGSPCSGRLVCQIFAFMILGIPAPPCY